MLADDSKFLGRKIPIKLSTVPHTRKFCVHPSERRNLKGFWDGNPLTENFNVYMVHIILMNFVRQFIYWSLRLLKQPRFVCDAIAGMLLGYGIGVYWPKSGIFRQDDIELLRTSGALGILAFIFIIAVKMDVSLIWKAAKNGSIIGLVSFLAPLLTIFTLLTFELSIVGCEKPAFRYLFSAGLSVTRFPNVAYAFDELNLLTSDLGQLVMSSAMLNEVFSWFSLVIGVEFRGGKNGKWALLSILALLLFTIMVVRPVMVSIANSTPVGKPMRPVLIVAILVGALIMAGIGDMIGSTHVGVLLMGLAVPHGPPLGSELVEKTELIAKNVLMPLFYLSMGYNTGLSQAPGTPSHIRAADEVHEVVLLVIFGCIAKFVGVLAVSLCCKLQNRHAILVGLMVNIKGPFDLYLFTRWLSKSNVKLTTYAILIISQVVVTAIVTPLIENLYNSLERLKESGSDARSIQGDPSTVELRVLLCVHEEDDVPGLISILHATNSIPAKPVRPYIAHLNELLGRAVPVISSNGNGQLPSMKSRTSEHIARAFDNYVTSMDGLVMMEIFTMIAPYKSMHENIRKLTQEVSIPLTIIPFNRNRQDDMSQAAIRQLNRNIQHFSPCTVGILVDNGLGRCMSHDYQQFFCNIAVIFIGGADDREALALGARMSGHKNMNLTVLRLIVRGKKRNDGAEMIEKKLDDVFLEGFWARNTKNKRVDYREVAVGNSQEAVNGIRSLGNCYDLVIVGRDRNAAESMFDKLMLAWTDYPELGIIGDFVSSSDFNGGNTSALVMQHCGDHEGSSQFTSSECEAEFLLGRGFVEVTVVEKQSS